MITLNADEKDLIRSNRGYLKKNNLKGFYKELSGDIRYKGGDRAMGHISQFLLENGIDIFEYMNEIVPGMFYGCELESIKLSDNITKIKREAFSSCVDLKAIDLGNSVKSIEEKAFANCGNLKRVFLPDSLTTLGPNIFEGCPDDIVLIANKRSGLNKLRCKQDEIPWYKNHLFLNEQPAESEEE